MFTVCRLLLDQFKMGKKGKGTLKGKGAKGRPISLSTLTSPPSQRPQESGLTPWKLNLKASFPEPVSQPSSTSPWTQATSQAQNTSPSSENSDYPTLGTAAITPRQKLERPVSAKDKQDDESSFDGIFNEGWYDISSHSSSLTVQKTKNTAAKVKAARRQRQELCLLFLFLEKLKAYQLELYTYVMELTIATFPTQLVWQRRNSLRKITPVTYPDTQDENTTTRFPVPPPNFSVYKLPIFPGENLDPTNIVCYAMFQNGKLEGHGIYYRLFPSDVVPDQPYFGQLPPEGHVVLTLGECSIMTKKKEHEFYVSWGM